MDAPGRMTFIAVAIGKAETEHLLIEGDRLIELAHLHHGMGHTQTHEVTDATHVEGSPRRCPPARNKSISSTRRSLPKEPS